MNSVKSKNKIIGFGVVIVLLITFFALCFLTISNIEKAKAIAQKDKDIKIIHMTDIHVMPDNYCNIYSEDFKHDSKGNTKLLEQSSSVLLTALTQIYEMPDDEAPMYILVSGDLTSNGEYEANLLVAEAYGQLTTKMRSRPGFENFQVFIIPGNHDMYNDASVSYMPTEEELTTFKTNYVNDNGLDLSNDEDDEMYQQALIDYLTTYKKRYVKTTTSEDMFKIYGDFGYNKNSSKLASNVSIKLFIESEYWYEPGKATVTYENDVFVSSTGLNTVALNKKRMEAWENSGKNFELITKESKIGACSYIAETSDYTFVCLDGSARIYEEKMKKHPELQADWNETTGGLVTDAMLKWTIAETRADVQADKMILTQVHFNAIPHFDAEDEVISLFTLDNWEEFSYTLAKNGLRYVFSGHQHANDIVYYKTQSGDIIYDFETCSAISYGSSYRSLKFTRMKDSNGEYYEDVKSTVHTVNYNNNSNSFMYNIYLTKYDAENKGIISLNKPVVVGTDGESIFECAEHLDQDILYNQGDIVLTPITVESLDGDKTNFGIGDFLAEKSAVLFQEMVAKYINNSLFDKITNGLSGALSDKQFIATAVNGLIDGLKTFDLYEFKETNNGLSFELGNTPKAGYDILTFVNDLADWLLNYDFSYGKIPGGKTLGEIFVEVYGGHLTGAGDEIVDECIVELVNKLNDGTFVEFLIDVLYRALIPQVDLILNAPIRLSDTLPELKPGKGFDLSTLLNTSSTGFVDGMAKSVVEGFALNCPDSNGYYSLKLIIKSAVDELLIKDLKEIPENKQDTASFIRRTISGLGGSLIGKVVEYVKQYLNSDLMTVIQNELLDKYVTKSFCRNLGRYAAYLVTSVDVDEFLDGSEWISGKDIYKYLAVKNTKDFNVTVRSIDGGDAYKNHAFYKSNTFNGKLEVTPTAENGLLPNMISVSFNDKNYDTEKVIRFVTNIEVDVFDKTKVPEAKIIYSTDKDFTNKKEIIITDGENIYKEIPTVDLGIMYINLNYRARMYNVYNVVIKDLTPGTVYYYKLVNCYGNETETYMFKTAKTEIEGFSFMAITDIQGSYEFNYTESSIDLYKAYEYEGIGEKAEFVVSCGDNVDNGKNIMQYSWWLNDQVKVWANQTLVSMAGNHEDDNYSLSDNIALPANAKVSQSGYYYSFDYGPAHFIIIDTNDLNNNKLATVQYNWLIKDLSETEKEWKIVMFHKGVQTAGSHAFDSDVIALRKQLMPIFNQYGVDLVLQGHDHTYSVSKMIQYDYEYDEEGYITSQTLKTADVNLNGANAKHNGTIYVNLGTMGDKFYKYIYSDEVFLASRKAAPNAKLDKFFVDGNLELTETPVFANISVDGKKLQIDTFTIVDGDVVKVDSIILGNSISKENTIIAIAVASVGGAGIILAVVLFFVFKRKVA